MTAAFDPRLLKVGITVNGTSHFYEDIDIHVSGQRFWSATAAFATIKLSNINRDERNWLLTNCSPVLSKTRTPAYVQVFAGRQSTGYFLLFQGWCYTSTVTQPPDIGITLRTLDNSALASAMYPTSFGAVTTLSTIAQYAANNANPKLILDFNVANNIQVANFSSTTNTNVLIQKLNELNCIATVNNGVLSVRDNGGFNANRSFVLAATGKNNGMVGLPQATDTGAMAQMLISPDVQIGDFVQLNSEINPSVNGGYTVSQIAFEAANRDTPFFYTLTLSVIAAAANGAIQ